MSIADWLGIVLIGIPFACLLLAGALRETCETINGDEHKNRPDQDRS